MRRALKYAVGGLKIVEPYSLDKLAQILAVNAGVGVIVVGATVYGLKKALPIYESLMLYPIKNAVNNGEPPFDDGQLWLNLQGNEKFQRDYFKRILQHGEKR